MHWNKEAALSEMVTEVMALVSSPMPLPLKGNDTPKPEEKHEWLNAQSDHVMVLSRFLKINLDMSIRVFSGTFLTLIYIHILLETVSVRLIRYAKHEHFIRH